MRKLIPQALLSNIPDLHSTEDVNDPVCHIKLFTPDANWTWYIIALSKSDESTCFGYVKGLDNELGYFSLDEIRFVRGSLGLPVERDLFYEPTRLSIVMEGL